MSKPLQKPADVHRVVAGTTFTDDDGIEHTVKPPCDDTKGGRWYCVTHKEAFRHQMAKDFHIGPNRRCDLVWWCFEHGPEQP